MAHFQQQKSCFKPLLSVIIFSFLFCFSFRVLCFIFFYLVTILHLNGFLIVVSCIDQKVSMLCSTFVHNRPPTPGPICAAQSHTNEEMISNSLSLLKISVLMINTMCFGKIVPNLACVS